MQSHDDRHSVSKFDFTPFRQTLSLLPFHAPTSHHILRVLLYECALCLQHATQAVLNLPPTPRRSVHVRSFDLQQPKSESWMNSWQASGNKKNNNNTNGIVGEETRRGDLGTL